MSSNFKVGLCPKNGRFEIFAVGCGKGVHAAGVVEKAYVLFTLCDPSEQFPNDVFIGGIRVQSAQRIRGGAVADRATRAQAESGQTVLDDQAVDPVFPADQLRSAELLPMFAVVKAVGSTNTSTSCNQQIVECPVVELTACTGEHLHPDADAALPAQGDHELIRGL